MNTAVQFDEEEAAGECWGPSLFQEKKSIKIMELLWLIRALIYIHLIACLHQCR